MFLSKLALYGTIAGTFFTVSAFSTVQISKHMNKTPVPNEVEEEEEEETYVRNMSDTERFINALTTFGNLEGNLNASIKKDAYEIGINANVFVSMETMEDIQVYADVNINALDRTFNIEATYVNNTIYATLEGNNLKLETKNINEITSLFSTMESSIELPETFQNIDANQLISNLSAMESEVGEDSITYTCNLIEGIPPIIFTSDLEYNMTSVTISDFEIEGFHIDTYATTKILGSGNNKITVPETDKKPYTNITSYFGVMKQVKNLINNKEANIGYSLDLAKTNKSIISTSGEASVSLRNGLELAVQGQLFNSNKSKSISYLAGYQGETVFLNFNDLIKVYYETANFEQLTNSISALLDNDMIKPLLENLDSVELPLMKMINEKDYNGLLAKYHNLFIGKEQIKLSISNSIFDENINSEFDIVINLNDDGIKNINITNLKYSDYSLSLNLEIKAYNKKNVNLAEYDNVSNIDKVIDQVNDLINSKKINLAIDEVSYGDYLASGYIQLDLENEIYNADINLRKTVIVEDEVSYINHRIRFENDDSYYYIAYSNDKDQSNEHANDVKLAIDKDNVNELIDSLKSFMNNEDGEFKKVFDELITKTIGNISTNEESSIIDMIFEDYLTKFDIKHNDNRESVELAINGDAIGLDEDINVSILLDENTNISGVNGHTTIKEDEVRFNVNLDAFDEELHAIPLEDRPGDVYEGHNNNGGWVGVSGITNAVTYVTSLDNDTQKAIVDQIKDIIENKRVGIDYNINVNKQVNNANELVFEIEGAVDLDLHNIKDLNSLKVNFNGNMTNSNTGKELDSNVKIKLYNGVVYFDYNNNLKFSYAISDIEDLIDLINNKISNSVSSNDVSDILAKLFPSKDSSTSAPIIDIIKSENYLSILNYYKDCYIDVNNNLNIVFDGALIGNDGVDIALTLNTDKTGINKITINGVYALGYTLNCEFDINDYQDFEVTTEEANTYTDLHYINKIFDKIYDLTQTNKFNITLNGTIDLGDSNLSINGQSYVELGEEDEYGNATDFGVANLTITDEKNKTHTIKLDVNRNKVSDDASEASKEQALKNSKVYLVYNNKLKASLNIKSISDTFTLIQDLAEQGNPLLEKISGLLTADTSNSTLTKVMNGEPEAILYDNTLKSITFNEVEHYYDIELSGDLFKKDSDDEVSPIHIYINLDDEYNFTGIGIKGSINGYGIDIDAGISEATNNELGRLNPNDSYFDFSEAKTLAEYLFNTATNKDFRIEGTVDVSLLSPFDIIVDIHISDEGETVAKVQFKDIPYFIGLTSISRSSTIYVVEKKVGDEMTRDIFIETTHKDHIWSSKTTDRIRLTTEEFANNMVYYLVNYTLGLTVDVSSASSNGDKDIDYASVLKAFSYSETNNVPSWNLTLDVGELASTSALNDAVITIKGTETSGSRNLNYIYAELGIISILSAEVEANVTSFDYSAVQSGYQSAITYAANHSNDSYNHK